MLNVLPIKNFENSANDFIREKFTSVFDGDVTLLVLGLPIRVYSYAFISS